jgi:transposase-like protein
VINTDLAPVYPSAMADIKKDAKLRRGCQHRPVQYLNNILEQDHRAVKRRVNTRQGFREFQAARRTIQAYEAINVLRKGQVRRVRGKDVRQQNRFIERLFELTLGVPMRLTCEWPDGWTYLYRAVDSMGVTIDFYLSETRDCLRLERSFVKRWRNRTALVRL